MIRIVLSDGTVIINHAPSKRRNGSTSIKRAQQLAALRRVGGTTNSVRATYKNGPLCNVVDRKLNATIHLGGSTPCGYVGGRGAQ